MNTSHLYYAWTLGSHDDHLQHLLEFGGVIVPVYVGGCITYEGALITNININPVIIICKPTTYFKI
jgi:hypothetical protein